MQMHFQLIYFITAFLNITLGALVFAHKPTDRLVRAFTAFVWSLSSWIITLYLFNTLTDHSLVILVGRLNYAFAELIALFVFLFVYEFPKKLFQIKPSVKAFIGIATLLVVLVTAATDLVDANEVVVGVSRRTEYGPLFPLFVVQFLGLTIASVIMLVRKYRLLANHLQYQVLIFTAGWGMTLLWGATTNILLPYLFGGNNDLANYGPLATLFLLFATGYTVVRHAMLNVKVIASEAFVIMMSALFVLQIATSVSSFATTLGVFSFVVAGFLGIGLVKNVYKEVQEREQLQTMAKELATANAHLRQMDEAKTEFLSIASHELRTPVSVIKGYISLMIEEAYGKMPAAAKEKLKHMYMMNERLVHIINNLLNTSRIERNKVEFLMTDIDMTELAKDAVEEMRYRAGEKRINIVLELPSKGLRKVMADEEKVHEVFINLIDNAIKYSPEGTSVTVTLENARSGKFVKVRVKDSGHGMSETVKNSLFQRYYRAEDTNTRQQKGTGLGLYICKRFIEGMGGTIEVERTEKDKGTVFAFTLPISVV